MNDESLRYPTGKFSPQETYTKQDLEKCIRRIETLPSRIESVIRKFSPQHFEITYREGGWSGRQVVHHISDSHMNAYIRFKWALTEDTPMIKAYDEKLWAETADVSLDPNLSVNLLRSLHVKLVALLRSLSAEDLRREYIHPETKKNMRLDRLIAMYAWHGDHHLGHLEIIAKKTV
jgi:hypothetical protein